VDEFLYHRQSSVTRRIVACPPERQGPGLGTRKQPADWGGRFPAWYCSMDDPGGYPDKPCIYVHWERAGGRGVRAGTVQLRSWRRWAKGGIVREHGE